LKTASRVPERNNLRLKTLSSLTTSHSEPQMVPQLPANSIKMSVQKIAASVTRQTNAVVISAGLMEKTVKVRVGVQKWNKHIGKVCPLLLSFRHPIPTSKFSIRISNFQLQILMVMPSISTNLGQSSSTTHAPPYASAT
jgi:hypothetical protein